MIREVDMTDALSEQPGSTPKHPHPLDFGVSKYFYVQACGFDPLSPVGSYLGVCSSY